MKTIFKIIYYGSILFIVIVVLISILLRVLPLEFANQNNQDTFDFIFFIGIPIAILLTLSRLVFKTDVSKGKIRNILILTILTSAGVFFLFILYAFATFGSGLCSWSTGPTIFKNVSSSSKIVWRDFGCGAVDSSPPTIEISKVTEITPLFIYITKVDTTKLDKKIWIRVDN